jgi:xylulokinase
VLGDTNYDGLAALASDAPVGCEGLTFLPYLSGERCPHNDPSARAVFAGATLTHGKTHFARSVFEGISFGLVEGLHLLQALGAKADDVRVTGGGAKNHFWMQMLADVFRVPCSTLRVDEGPAFGAAILAGVGIGVWENVEKACRQTVQKTLWFEPSGSDYGKAYERFQRLYPTLRQWYREE